MVSTERARSTDIKHAIPDTLMQMSVSHKMMRNIRYVVHMFEQGFIVEICVFDLVPLLKIVRGLCLEIKSLEKHWKSNQRIFETNHNKRPIMMFMGIIEHNWNICLPDRRGLISGWSREK